MVFLLENLWEVSEKDETRRKEYCTLLNKLCDKAVLWGEQINFKMQVYEEDEDEGERRWDFEIASPDSVLVRVEVKDTALISQVFTDDKRRLRKEARRRGYKDNRLVLLRHYYVSKGGSKGVDSDVRWSQLYSWIRDTYRSGIFAEDCISHYLLKHFLQYLEAKGVIMSEANIDRIETGFADLIGLLKVVKGEAENLFFEKEGLKKVETAFDQAHRLKHLEQENTRLKKLVADLSLDNEILKEASRGNF